MWKKLKVHEYWVLTYPGTLHQSKSRRGRSRWVWTQATEKTRLKASYGSPTLDHQKMTRIRRLPSCHQSCMCRSHAHNKLCGQLLSYYSAISKLHSSLLLWEKGFILMREWIAAGHDSNMNWYSTYCKLSCTAWYCAGLFPSRQFDVCVDASSYMLYT